MNEARIFQQDQNELTKEIEHILYEKPRIKKKNKEMSKFLAGLKQ